MNKITLKRVPEEKINSCDGCYGFKNNMEKCSVLCEADKKKDCISENFIYENAEKLIRLKRVPGKGLESCRGCYAEDSLETCRKLMDADTKKNCLDYDFVYKEN